MWAAKAGHVPGVSKEVVEEFTSQDPGGHLPARAKDLAPEEFGLIKRALVAMGRFFSEEAEEPEHAQDDQKRDEAGRFAMGAQGGKGARVGETANTPSEHHEANVFHAKMGKFHGGRNEREHAEAHNSASEAHHEARRGGGWESEVAREASRHANEKSGLNKGFQIARDEKPAGRAASVAFVAKDGRTLFIRRAADAADPHGGKWCWPGGQAEEGEAFDAAARREALEEAGPDCSFDSMRELHRARTERGWDHVTYTVPVDEPFEPTLSDECADHRWAYPDEAPEPLHPGCRATIDAVLVKGAEDAWSPEARAAALEARRRKAGGEGAAYAGKPEGKPHSSERVFFHADAEKHHAGRAKSFEDLGRGYRGGVHPGVAAHNEAERKHGLARGAHGLKSANAEERSKVAQEASKHAESLYYAKDAADPSGKLSKTTEKEIGSSAYRKDMPESAFLQPSQRRYPVKEERDGEYKYTRNLLLAAARRARLQGREDLARRADAIRAREFPGGGEDDDPVRINLGGGRTGRINLGGGRIGRINGDTPLEPAPGGWLRQVINAGSEMPANVRSQRVKPEQLKRSPAYNTGANDEQPIDWSKFRVRSRQARDRVLAMDKSLRRFDPDGRMHVDDSVITAAQINDYLGEEIPDWERLGLDPRRRYRVFRDPEELRKAVDTFNGLPIFERHEPASAEDHPRELTIGATGNNAKFDGEKLTNSLVIWPRDASAAVVDGEKRELSCGYAYEPEVRSGQWKGQDYDIRMKNIVGNHLATVAEGRVRGAKVADAKLSFFNRMAAPPAYH